MFFVWARDTSGSGDKTIYRCEDKHEATETCWSIGRQNESLAKDWGWDTNLMITNDDRRNWTVSLQLIDDSGEVSSVFYWGVGVV